MTLATLWHWKWWLVNVGPNIVASVICFVSGLALGWYKWGRRWAHRLAEHERRVEEMHRVVVHDQGPKG